MVENREAIHIGAELTQCLIEVVHLRHDGHHGHNQEDISRRVSELIVSRECELESDSESLDSADGDTADGAADTQVDQGVFLAVCWRDFVDHEKGEGRDNQTVS